MLFRPSSPLLLPVSHIEQEFSGDCLAACAAMALDYLGIPLPYNRLVKLLQIKRPIGAPFSNIRELEKQRLRVLYKEHGALQELYEYLANDLPCIVDVATEELAYWGQVRTRHVVVVIGMDEKNVYLNDPEFANAPARVSLGEFDLAWLQRDERYAVLMP